jgi:hypothetical protein
MPEQTQQRQDAFETHIRLKSIEALFNSLDPSPLVERDLDDTVEDYLVDCVRDAPSGAPLELVLHLPDSSADRVNGDAVGLSVTHYFSFLSDRQARRIRRLLREGRQAALVGILFLAGCTLGAQAMKGMYGGAMGALFAEGLLIIGWVANWRPVSIFLYEWRPMRQEMRIYDRLARLNVALRRDAE